ncbi:phosphoribosyltransferase [Komagataeibacter nataicola]|uniref:Phosphoribosyltransferase n=1 Tax=Komagataeibacter nataicola TaxID=265960 RepID=A0A9N7GZ70_9PROT|nr:phosphoribosyltransferase [Komagataeibacter nataicola]AQU86339.1 phosphoribosyltransferase [Komagataeibacter nataicola]PYD66578.1 phosphoribosyltransferase [Komagataeibacter nataicola]WEQ56782.1 phosphoribosyltransferase [Komagataeibacter nataicola]WNM08254.1 phosphoribosyltransferase [Komagataeibacter nataicola]GBR18901.1 phosphoribosyltransferase [Komagataeibacter nataicola NRIC 0616]
MTPASYSATWSPDGAPAAAPPYGESYPVRLTDGSTLTLPLRALPGGERAIALLMANQTGFAVECQLTRLLAGMVGPLAPQAIVGVPTMGLAYARPVAEKLGFDDYVALGHSRKFWYDDSLAIALTSSTSPDQTKHLYLDPALVERVRGRRVVVIDDVLNTGRTAAAAVQLLKHAGACVVAIAAVLTEGWAWRAALDAACPGTVPPVHALGHIPLFGGQAGNWRPLPGT